MRQTKAMEHFGRPSPKMLQPRNAAKAPMTKASPDPAAASRQASARLDIVIVNWNSGALLADCLDALAGSTIADDLHVFVVDNASHDGSWQAAEAAYPIRVTLMRNPDNRGFGAACNQAAFAGTAPHILFLNPDTRVLPDTLEKALNFIAQPFQGGQAPGVAGVQLVDDTGEVQRTCANAPSAARLLGRALAIDKVAPGLVTPLFMTSWDHGDTRPVAQVMGAFLLIGRPLFVQLGGFDERFFVYYEDMDLCVRAGGAGRSVVHYADARVWHQSQGTTAQVKDRRQFYFWRSEALFAAKHYGLATAWAVLAAQLLVQTPLRVAQTLARRRQGARQDEWRQVLRGASMLLRDLPALAGKLRDAARR